MDSAKKMAIDHVGATPQVALDTHSDHAHDKGRRNAGTRMDAVGVYCDPDKLRKLLGWRKGGTKTTHKGRNESAPLPKVSPSAVVEQTTTVRGWVVKALLQQGMTLDEIEYLLRRGAEDRDATISVMEPVGPQVMAPPIEVVVGRNAKEGEFDHWMDRLHR